MTPAKPQHMSRDTDNSEDLMNELARLMAEDVKGSAEAKVSPQGDTPASAASAQKIPLPPRPAVRIPGMETPPPPPTDGKARALDFGSLPAPTPIATPEPLSRWQERSDRHATASGSGPDQAKAPDQTQAGVPPKNNAGSAQSPVTASASAKPYSNTNEAGRPTPSPAPVKAPVEFDFGLTSSRASGPALPAPERTGGHRDSPLPAPSTPADGVVDDPIAALISAELDAAPPEAQSRHVPAANTTSPGLVPGEAAPNRDPSRAPAPPAKPLPDNDRFVSAPVFGLGGGTARTAEPQQELDPIDEIESLIGEAVRVDIAPPARVSQAPTPRHEAADETAPAPASASVPPSVPDAPVVPPLDSQFAPRRTTLREPPMGHDPADAAILAAAIDSGAAVTWSGDLAHNGHLAASAAAAGTKTSRRRRSGPWRLVGGAVVLTLLLIGGIGGYWWYEGAGHAGGPVPTLVASAVPARKAPPAVAAAPDTPRSVVYDQLSGDAPTGKEELVSRDQSAGRTDLATAVPADGEIPLANRKVRTVTVRPDGTIVSNGDSLAGSEKLPVARPDVPAIPGVSAVSNPLTVTPPDTSTNGAANGASADNTAAGNATVDTAMIAPVPMPPLARAEGTSAPVNAIVGGNSGRPLDLIGNLVAQSTASTPAPASAVAAEPAANTSASSPSAASTNAPAYVQLSSRRSESAAQASLNTIQSKYGAALGGGRLEIERADLGTKGVYYRVRLPANSLQAASQICASVKAAGGDCFPTRG